MSLLERVELTSGRIESLQSLKDLAAQAAEFEQRAKTLEGLANEFEELRVPAAVLEEVGIEVSLDAKLLGALHSKAVLLKDGYTRERNFILTPFPGEDFRFVFVNPCVSFKKKTKAALHDAWLGWVQKNTPAIDHDVLQVLSTINALGTAVASIQAVLGVIHRLATILPQSVNEARQVVALCSQVNEAWHQLAGDGIAQEVLAFLRAAGGSVGATYDLLTPSILEWLDEHNLRHVLRIRLG